MASHSCVSCDSQERMTRFDHKVFTIEHAGMHVEVQGLSGWECGSCGDVEFDPESAKRYAEAGDELVLLARQRERNRSGAFDGS